jgi:hypothetical protein
LLHLREAPWRRHSLVQVFHHGVFCRRPQARPAVAVAWADWPLTCWHRAFTDTDRNRLELHKGFEKE